MTCALLAEEYDKKSLKTMKNEENVCRKEEKIKFLNCPRIMTITRTVKTKKKNKQENEAAGVKKS